jgi:glycerol-3-phosphate dehydrogenase (NAD(P)+)
VNLGRGRTVAETIEATKQTCEGYKSCEPILALAQGHGVDMPITEQVVAVVHHGRSPRTLAAAFMSRDTKRETVIDR